MRPELPEVKTAPLGLPGDTGGGWLVSVDGCTLPLVGSKVTATAAGGMAGVVLEQRFRNAHPVALSVVYTLPLPFDAAVTAYAFTVGGRRIVGQIDRREAARERFEQALLEGRSAALVQQDRSSLFQQEIGNIPAGAEVVATLTLDQRLRWLDEGAWEWRFPMAAGPRYRGGDERASPGGRGGDVRDIADGPLPARMELALTVGDRLAGAPDSPSHRIRSTAGGSVALEAEGGVPLDRDLVVRWPVDRPAEGLSLELARPPAGAPHGEAAHGLLSIVPGPEASRPDALARDLVVLIDTSGSMAEEPLRQARRVVAALVDSLDERDRLELIEFSREPRRWREGPVPASPAMRREALAWLAQLQASGGTEMRQGIEEALRPLRPDSQRQVVLVTDGLIGAETQVVRAISQGLPASSRLHTVGVGSAVNRSLTGPAARAGRGVEVVVGLGEDAERAARRLVARTAAPLVVDLVIHGPALYTHAPARLPDLFAGAPVLVGLALRPEGGTLTVEGRTARGRWRQTLEVAATAPGAGRAIITALFGRERVEDLETRIAAGEDPVPLELEIVRLGLDYQLATRLTSWVAISEEASVDPGQPIRRVHMPQELPAGMSVHGLGLRRAAEVPAGTSIPTARVARDMASASVTWGGRRPLGLAGGAPRVPPSWRSGAPVAGGAIVRGFIPPRAELGQEWPPAAGGRGPAGVEIRQGEGNQRTLAGRTARQSGGLAIHFAVDAGGLIWRIGHEVELVGPDGRRATARVVQARPPGTVGEGEEIWIVVEPPPAGWEPGEVLISAGPELIAVVL
jgi:Ca-activated chloride channel family protein